MTCPTERERLAEQMCNAFQRITNPTFTPWECVAECLRDVWLKTADAILADGFHREGAPRTPAPTEDLPPIKITAEVHCQCGTDFERDFTVEPATLRTAIDYARKQLAGRGEGET